MHDTTTDAQLVARHLAGDRSALAAIYDRYADSLYDTAAAMTRQRHDAADVLQDVFVAAAERMGQLREPDKLKPWLFAILRNEVYRRTRRQRRTVATDFTDPVAEMTAPSQPADEGSAVELDELASLVRAAAAGLDERDQLVLELSVRQGLQGDDLAAALGVSTQQGYGLVHRMRQRTERSLGAYCVARAGRKDCAELAEILRGWDGEFSVLIRKRVARHVDGCDVCERRRRGIAPFALFGAAPALAAPSELRERVLAAAGGPQPPPPYGFEAPGGFPSVIGRAYRWGLWLLAATTVLVVTIATTLLVVGDEDETVAIDDPPTTPTDTTSAEPATAPVVPPAPDDAAPGSSFGSTTAETTTTTGSTSTSTSTTTSTTTTTTTTTTTPATTVVGVPVTTVAGTPAPSTVAPAVPTTPTVPPGVLSVSAGSIDFGTQRDQVAVTLSNTGGRAVDWVASVGPSGFRTGSPFSFQPAAGSLAPGAQVQVTVSVDRSGNEGPVPTHRLLFTAPGTSAGIELRAEIARPPVIRPTALPPATTCIVGGQAFSWQLVLADESPPVVAAVSLALPDGTVLGAQVGGDGSAFVDADLDGDGLLRPGGHTWTVTATDQFGNVSTLSGSTSVTEATFGC